MAALEHEYPFDPLIDLDGLWTVELGHRYLPIEGMPPARYEAVGGRLRTSPREGSANSWATLRLANQLESAADTAGHAVYSALNVRTGLNGWIEPDLVVLRYPAWEDTWIEAEQVLCPIEIISRWSYHRDRIDKPAICAQLGIPYYLHAEIRSGEAKLELFRLGPDGRYLTHASAISGQLFQTDDPFPLSFDPAVLIERRRRPS